MLGKLLGALGAGGPVEMRTAEELRPGKALVHGVVTAETQLSSPVNQRPCVAVYYRGSYRRASRLKGFQQEFLRDALTYSPELKLHVGDVEIDLDPVRNDDFTHADHLAFKASDLDNYSGREQRVPDGAEVRAEGRLSRDGDRWVMRLEGLHYDPPPKPAAPEPEAEPKPKPKPKTTSRSGGRGAAPPRPRRRPR